MNIALILLGAYAMGLATPLLKKLIAKIINKGYEKMNAEIDRWH